MTAVTAATLAAGGSAAAAEPAAAPEEPVVYTFHSPTLCGLYRWYAIQDGYEVSECVGEGAFPFLPTSYSFTRYP